MLLIASRLALVMFSFAIKVRSSLAWVMASLKNNSSLSFSRLRVSHLYFHVLSRRRFLVSFVGSGCGTGVVCCCFVFVSWSLLLESSVKDLLV